LTIEAILAAAVEENAPVIIQTSVKTVRQYGRDQLFAIFTALGRDVPVPAPPR
jgi:fructose-bisphosphate aldolase class II